MTDHLIPAAVAVHLLVIACAPSPQARLEENKQLVRRFVEASNERSWDELDRMVAPEFVRHSQATPDVQVENREQFMVFLRQDAATFPDSRVTIERLVAEGDLVAFSATYSGTQEAAMGPFPPSGKRMEVDFAGIFRIEDGMLAELWVTWDNMTALTQLGHWPPAPAPPPPGS